MLQILTKDTNRAINENPMRTLYLMDNKGNCWKETNYKGDYIFGGKDFFALVSEMNNLSCDCKSDLCKLTGGSDLFFNEDIEIMVPNVVESENWVWIQ